MATSHYIGIVKDDLGALETLTTKPCDTYYEAHMAAEKLCKKTYGDRGSIDVIQTETERGD